MRQEGKLVVKHNGTIGMIEKVGEDEQGPYIIVRYMNYRDGKVVLETIDYTDNPIDFRAMDRVSNIGEIKRMSPERKRRMVAYISGSRQRLEDRCSVCLTPARIACNRYELTGCCWKK